MRRNTIGHESEVEMNEKTARKTSYQEYRQPPTRRQRRYHQKVEKRRTRKWRTLTGRST